MKYSKPFILLVIIPLTFLSACEASSHEKHSEVKQSMSKGKNNMLNLNAMLNEIFKIRITDISSQRADVSHIVSQYIRSGTPRQKINSLISGEFEILEDSNNELFIHYRKGEGNLGNRRDLYINLFFDKNGNLLRNISYLDKSNNL